MRVYSEESITKMKRKAVIYELLKGPIAILSEENINKLRTDWLQKYFRENLVSYLTIECTVQI